MSTALLSLDLQSETNLIECETNHQYLDAAAPLISYGAHGRSCDMWELLPCFGSRSDSCRSPGVSGTRRSVCAAAAAAAAVKSDGSREGGCR